jgi:hypothetical protein
MPSAAVETVEAADHAADAAPDFQHVEPAGSIRETLDDAPQDAVARSAPEAARLDGRGHVEALARIVGESRASSGA